jgi:hypothetical protein
MHFQDPHDAKRMRIDEIEEETHMFINRLEPALVNKIKLLVEETMLERERIIRRNIQEMISKMDVKYDELKKYVDKIGKKDASVNNHSMSYIS